MKYNIKTRNKEGKFYRNGDWGQNPLSARTYGDNFTEKVPPAETIDHGVPCDWDGSKWKLDTNSDEYKGLYKIKRKAELPTIDDLVVALWEREVENRPEAADALQIERVKVKEKFPKP